MVGWSSLLRKASVPLQILAKTPLRNNVLTKIPCRTSGHGPETMHIRPSTYSWEVFKDMVHLYIMVGAIPWACLIFYCDVFIGPAKLAPIPEGYEPKEWEYYRHPITRFIAKYAPSPQEKYERRCHMSHEAQEINKLRLLERKVRRAMMENLDYQGWYYHPADIAKYHRVDIRKTRHDVIHESKGGADLSF